MFVTFLDVVIAGLLMGGIYALIAVGLNLQFGVARVLNISHGEFVMLGAFLTWSLYSIFHINPILSLIIVGPFIFLIGFFIHRILFKPLRNMAPTMGIFEGNSMLASFGIMFIIQNIALLIWGANLKGYVFMDFSIDIFGALFGANRVLAMLFALVICAVFYVFLMWTRTGKAIRAASQDPSTAQTMGVNIHWVLGLCFALGALMAGLAGVLVSMIWEITPNIGMPYTIIAIIVIILGGLGNIPGSLLGGIILGLVGSIVTAWDPGLTMVAYYFIFIVILFARPTGIFGR